MKKYLSLLLLISFGASAQWSNTTNQFFDSLHTPVTKISGDQSAPLVVQSFPDSGYIVIWQDNRNYATSKGDIYAQKYDKAGVRLWAENGVPVTTGPNNQYYTFSSNEDYRSRSFAATDSAGGFYVCYTDDSVSNYSWPRIAVQHVRSDGSAVFGGAGYIVGAVPADGAYAWGAPQLIANGVGGFYLSAIRGPYNQFLYVFDGKDSSGVLSIARHLVNANAVQRTELGPCGLHNYVEYPAANVNEYNIWPDGQGGCGVVMYLSGNGLQGTMLGYNRLWRPKKDAVVRKYKRNESGVPCPYTVTFNRNTSYLLYNLSTNSTTTYCYTPQPIVVYAVTNTFLLSNGYGLVDNGAYAYDFPKGVTVAASNKMNVTMLAATQRTLSGNNLSDFFVKGYAFGQEVYDSLPYQWLSSGDADNAYAPDPTAIKLAPFRDTLLASGNYYPDFCLAGGGGNFFAAGLMTLSGNRNLRLQRLHVNTSVADSFYLEYDADKKGDVIGRELSTGFQGTNIYYDFPIVRVNASGNAMFSILESGRFTRVSPIGSKTQLSWGAVGRPAGTGIYNYGYAGNDQSFLLPNATTGEAVLAWRDSRFNGSGFGTDILMRHLDRMNETVLYEPPVRQVRLVPNPYGPSQANPAILLGTSKAFTPFEIASIYYEPSTTTIAEIVDNQNLGRVNISMYQNTGAIRSSNGQTFLDRNFTITTDNAPSGTPLTVRLYFTKAEFNALKAAEPLVQNPSDLAVIVQPPSVYNAPGSYSPVSGEKTFTPSSWDSVAGGYFIEFNTAGFGNFFITRATPTVICPGGNATLTSNVTGSTYQWQVGDGTTFSPLQNDATTSGVNTATLQLSNVPSLWNGFKLRCLVYANPNLLFSNTFSLQISSGWTGAVSNDWNTPGNWGCGTVPDANTDVILTSGNVEVTGNAACRTLTVKPPATVTVRPGVTLTVAH